MVLDIPARTLTYEQVLDLSVPAPTPMAVPGPGPVPPRQGGHNQPTQHPDPNRRQVQVHPGHPYPPPNSNPVPRPQTLPRHHAPPTDGQALGMTTQSRPPVHHAYPNPYPRLHGHHPPTSTLNARAHIHAQHNYNHLLGEDEDAKYKRHLQNSLGLATNADPGLPRGMGMERGMVGGSGSAHRAPNIPAFSHGHAHTHGRVQSSRVQPGYRQGHLGQDEDANFKRNLHNTLRITNANVNNAPSGGSSGAMGPSSMGLGNQRRITRPWEL